MLPRPCQSTGQPLPAQRNALDDWSSSWKQPALICITSYLTISMCYSSLNAGPHDAKDAHLEYDVRNSRAIPISFFLSLADFLYRKNTNYAYGLFGAAKRGLTSLYEACQNRGVEHKAPGVRPRV